MKKSKHKILYITIAIILATIVLTTLFILTFIQTEKEAEIPEETCTNIRDLTTLNYKACYHSFSKHIFLEIKNKGLVHDGARFEISFIDSAQRTHGYNLPEFNTSFFKMVPATQNPLFGEIYLLSTTEDYCNISKSIPIGNCPTSYEENPDILAIISTTDTVDFNYSDDGQEIPLKVVDTDKIWELLCKSEWSCEEWGECIDGVQRKDCVDLKECTIPTSVPQRVKQCDDICQESWRCSWPECKNGVSTPSCTDRNDCGTTFNKPTQVPCTKECTPDISCNDWSECSASYDFLTISGQDYLLNGQQTRTCTDQEGCVSTSVTTRDCSLVIDIYTTSFEKCDKEYIGIYNSLNDELLVNIEKSANPNQLNIDLSGQTENIYCDYCFDGTLNGDEDQIDCGGSCSSCASRKVDTDFSRNIFEKILDAISSIF